MDPDRADIPGRQWLKKTHVPLVDTVSAAVSVLANEDESVIAVRANYDMMQSELGRLVAGHAIQFTTSFGVALCGMLQERQKEEYW